jgi:predicted transcriptional regulator
MSKANLTIERTDNNGNIYTLTVKGQKIPNDKYQQILDVLDLLCGTPNESQLINSSNNIFTIELSLFEKIQSIVQKNFSLIWFASKDIQTVYERELKEPINLSTVSTYLSRMTNKGLLIRTGTGNNIKYKTAPSLQKIKQTIKTSY